MTTSIRPDLNGVAVHVHDGKRCVHITDPADTPEAALLAAERWMEGANPLHGFGGRRQKDAEILANM